MVFLVAGIALILTGGTVSIGFWMPGVINRNKLREFLGSKYSLVYLVYFANGPVLVIAGILLVMRHFAIIG